MYKKIHYLRRILSSYIWHRGGSNLTFWHTRLMVNDLTKEDLTTLRAYPQNYEDKIGRIGTADADGVIMLDYRGELGLQYNPNAIAQLALGYYDRILKGEDCRREFLAQAAYFLNHMRLVPDDILLWEYEFPFEMRNDLHAPWRSALAQGQGISVCLRAFRLTGDETYLHVTHKAFNAFRRLAREHAGGVLDDDRGYLWLEEYIVTPPNHVLNGFIWALWGVRDYAVFFEDSCAWDLWRSCLQTLKKNMHRYDLGFWTSYDLAVAGHQPVMPSSLYYQNLHVIQMQAMYKLTGDDIFDSYARKWENQLSNSLYRILSQAWKVYFKLRWF